MARPKKATKQLRIVVLSQLGLDDWEIAERIGCPESDVRVARKRASIAAAKRKPVTSQSRIAELARAGVADEQIAAKVGCRLEYVRVARQRAGLYRPRAKGDGPRTRTRAPEPAHR